MLEFAQAAWRKSSSSNANPQGNCFELARVGDTIGIRDSKHPDVALTTFTPAELTAFLEGARAGEFDDLA